MNNTLKNHYRIISRMAKLRKYNVSFTLTNTELKVHIGGEGNLTIPNLNVFSTDYVDTQLDWIEEELAEKAGYPYHVYVVHEYLSRVEEERLLGSYKTREFAQKEADKIDGKYRYCEVRHETINYN